jgi:hypothetical protein
MSAETQWLARFLGASTINLPLTGVLTWGLFSVLKQTNLPRAFAVLISCIIIAVALGVLGKSAGGSFDEGEVYQQIAIGIWLIVGLFFWGKPKNATPPTSPPTNSSSSTNVRY